MIVVLVVVAGAIGYAVYDSTTGSETSTESAAVPSAGSDSVAIVQSEIDAALALKTAPPSSVDIVNAEIEAALAGTTAGATGFAYPDVSTAEREFLAEHGMTPPRP